MPSLEVSMIFCSAGVEDEAMSMMLMSLAGD
jgi:hypothetical protein